MHLPCRSFTFLATFFYIGYIPFAPGTFGSLAGVLLFICVFSKLPPLIYIIILATLFFLGIWASEKTDDFYKTHDNSIIVIDEVVGMLASLFLIPFTWKNVFLGFLLFRIFDIIKVPPANILDRKKTGFGTMGDDLVSGVYANIALCFISRFWS